MNCLIKVLRCIYIWGLKNKYRSQNNVFFGKKSDIDSVSAIGNDCFIYGIVSDCKLEDHVTVYGKTLLCNVGRGSYIADSFIENADIGRFCSIGSNVRIIRGQHPSSGWISTSPSFYSEAPANNLKFTDHEKFREYRWTDEAEKKAVKLGPDVWIGNDVRIMEGIRIGDGAIIAAGAVVTKDVPDYAIVGGVPAEIIRYRFGKEEIEHLKSVAWWNKDLNWIKANADSFENFEKFSHIED